MTKRRFINEMISVLKTTFEHGLIILVIMSSAIYASGADELTRIQIPDHLSPYLAALLELADPENHHSIQTDDIEKLLKFIEEPKDPNALYFADPKLGSPSAYFDFDIQLDLKHFLQYAYNPNIPAYVLSPSSTRLSYWKQVQGSHGRLPEFWKTIDELEAPIIVKGLETIENTPDVFSGAYYRYDLYRTLILFKTNQRRVILSISKQKNISDVGKKGYVLGSDDNWDYFYSGKPGLTIPGLGWVRSHMYDSYGINIYIETEPDAPVLRCAVFKWITAGWSKINVVKNHHIHNGIKRFAKSLKAIIEHPTLPSSDALSSAHSNILALTDDELKINMKTYLNILETRYGREYRPLPKWSPQVFEDRDPWFQMPTEAMQAALMKEYLKRALGKRAVGAMAADQGL